MSATEIWARAVATAQALGMAGTIDLHGVKAANFEGLAQVSGGGVMTHVYAPDERHPAATAIDSLWVQVPGANHISVTSERRPATEEEVASLGERDMATRGSWVGQ